jgi:hypothetical protein
VGRSISAFACSLYAAIFQGKQISDYNARVCNELELVSALLKPALKKRSTRGAICPFAMNS